MKYYILVTGILFALLVIAHGARVYLEGFRVLGEPVFLVSTLVSILLCIWAVILFKKLPKLQD